MIRRFPLALLVVVCASNALVNLVTPATAAPGDISTVAGSQGEGQALNVAMEPNYLAMAGPLLYIGDYSHNVVRVLDTRTGVTRVVAGNGFPPPHAVAQVGDGAAATEALLGVIQSVATDPAGNLYIVDGWNGTVRKVDAAGRITTYAGVAQTCCAPFGGDGGSATSAPLSLPFGLGFDRSGNLYISEQHHNRIRKVSPLGVITTLASVSVPDDLAVDAAGNVYVSAASWLVQRISPAGVVTTVAGNGSPVTSGDGGPATSAGISVEGLTVDPAGNLYIADFSGRIRRVDAVTGVIRTVAGSGDDRDGEGIPATSARLESPDDVAVDAGGNLYIADRGSRKVRRVDAGTGRITTVAGNGESRFSGDGAPATQAELDKPQAVAVDAVGNQYIADTYNSRLRKVDVFGTITTLAEVSYPEGVAVDPVGRVYVASGGSIVYRVDLLSGAMTPFAGGGVLQEAEAEGRPATEAFLSFTYDSLPVGMVFDRLGNMYLSDSGWNRIVKVDTAGILTTVVAGDNERYCGFIEDINETLHCPTGLGIDPAGNLYVAEPYAQRLRKVDPSGTLTTINMPWPSVSPVGVAVDGVGNVFFSDPSSSLVFRIDPQGNGVNVAGESWPGFDGDGGPSDQAALFHVMGLAVAGADLYLADTYNHRIRRIVGAAQPTSTFQVRSWGWNAAGQLGTGSTIDSRSPVTVPGLGKVWSVAVGYYHSLAIKNGEVYAWGWNALGQLGNGTRTDSAVPVKVPGLTNVARVAAGAYHSLATTLDGKVYAWGYNAVGQLGDGTTTDRLQPVDLSLPGRADYVAAGAFHSVAQAWGGSVWTWGWNGAGQLGDGTTTDRHTPIAVPGLPTMGFVAAGAYHTLALRGGDDRLYAWGWNALGQLGDGTTTDRHRPVPVPIPSVGWVAAGAYHTLAHAGYNKVYAWGWNGVGQLGDGTTIDRHAPVPVSNLLGVAPGGLAAGAYHSLALRTDGTVRGWGWNVVGELGDGTLDTRTTPVPVPGLKGAYQLSGGAFHSVAM